VPAFGFVRASACAYAKQLSKILEQERVMRIKYLGLLLAAALALRGEATLPVFTDVSKSAGISFNHCLGAKKISNIVEATGSGCGWIDFDRDGKLDLYVVNACYLEGISDPR
jgi:hypothetical protein